MADMDEYLLCAECGRSRFTQNGPVTCCQYCGSEHMTIASRPPDVLDYRDLDTWESEGGR